MKKFILKLLCFLSFFIFFIPTLRGQNSNGNFRTRQSGNWNGTTTWQLRTAGSWANTTSIPTSADVVSIQNGHTVTVDANSSAGDVHLNSSGVIACNTFFLSLSGKIRAYTGTTVTTSLDATYTNSTNPATGNITCGSGGRLKFVGNSRNITVALEWGANGLTSSAVVEFALTSGQTGTLNTGFKANTFFVSSGSIDMGSNRLAPDNGTAGQADVTIASGAALISSSSSSGNPVMSRTGTPSTGRSGTFTLNGILRLNGASPFIEFQNVTLNNGSTVEYNGGAQTWINTTYTNAQAITSYANISLLGSGIAKTMVASQTTTVNGTLSIQGTATLSLGTSSILSYGSSAVLEYKGSSAQATGAAPAEWPVANGPNNVTLNNANGLTLGVARSIGGTLALTNGMLTTTTGNLLSLDSSANVTGASNSSFVNGPIKKTGSTSFIFPVGKSATGYHPVEISAPSNMTDAFTAEYMRIDPNNLSSVLSGGLSRISGCEYWLLDRSAGTSSVDVSLYGNTNSGCNTATGANYFTGNGSLLSDIKVSHFNSVTSTWENTGGSTTGTSPDIVTMTSVVSNFGPFTFGSVSTNPLPVKLISFTAESKMNNGVLKWSTASEKDNDHFDIERSNDGIGFKKTGEVKGKGTTNSISHYSFTDSIPLLRAELNFQTQSCCYRLKQVDYDNRYEYSPVAFITFEKQNEKILLDVFPNPFKNSVAVNYYLTARGNVTITIVDDGGKTVYSREYASNKGLNTARINTVDLVKGIYLIMLNGNGIKTYCKFALKE